MAQFLAMPYEQSPDKEATILGAVAEHPWWFTAPSTYEQRLLSTSLVINDPFNRLWEVWNGGTLVGILILQRINWGVDALMHFVFFDRALMGKRDLLFQWMRHCFDDLGFKRLTIELPENSVTMLAYVRRKLGFRFEGEDHLYRCLVNDQQRDPRKGGPKIVLNVGFRKNHREPIAVALAGLASRREATHWNADTKTWMDTLCLRITNKEFTAFVESSCPPPSLPPSPPPSPRLPPENS